MYKIFTCRLPRLSSYSDRLIKTNFPALELRHLQADLTLLHNNVYNNMYISCNMFVFRLNMVLTLLIREIKV